MVARLNTGKNISRVLAYNEQKVECGAAALLYAHQFIAPAAALDMMAKQKTFAKYHSLNQWTRTNSLHLSLNFHPQEKLDQAKLIAIARFCMKGIGFDNQPYLVYQHYDSGHPHLHIVSTNIDVNGNRICMSKVIRNQFEKTRKAAEQYFGIIKANQQPAYTLNTPLQKIQYGAAPTKTSIQQVLDAVLTHYLYTSLDELNAVLQQYNVNADNGSPTSLTRLHKGLRYAVLDDKGRQISMPIKASHFNNKPTLAWLEPRFIENQAARQQAAMRIAMLISYTFSRYPSADRETILKKLSTDGIAFTFSRANRHAPRQIFFIDHRNKSVVSNSHIATLDNNLSNKITLLLGTVPTPTAADQDFPVSFKKRIRRKKKKKLTHVL